MIRNFACALALLGVTWSFPNAAVAASELTVSPTIVRLDARAGETLDQTIAVSATGDEGITVEFEHVDFGFDDASYQTRVIRDDAPETTSFSTRGWFSVPKDRYVVKAGSTVKIPLTIEVPENTPGGVHLGGGFVRVVPTAVASGQVQTVAETGPLYFINVAGGDPPRPKITKFELDGLMTEGPIEPLLVVSNSGDDFFTFEGEVTLSGAAKDTVLIKRQYVVPEQPRRVRGPATKTGAGDRLLLGERDLGYGRYEVRAKLRVDPTGTTLTSTRTVWIVPIWARVLAAVLLVVFIAVVALLARWLWARSRRVAMPPDPLLDDHDEVSDEPRRGFAGARDPDVHDLEDDLDDDDDDLDDDDLDDEDSASETSPR